MCQVDRAQTAAPVRRQRLFRAGVGRCNRFAISEVVVEIDAIQEQHAWLGVIVGRTHDLVPEITCPSLSVHPETIFSLVGARIALAGRSPEKLLAVRETLGEVAQSWPILTADAASPSSLNDMAARTRVVITTVGPYSRYGLPLVAACAAAGTDYADLTGEAMFVRQSIDDYHKEAVDTGARIVHACGFDSIPSDMSVFALYRRAQQDGTGELGDTNWVLRGLKGARLLGGFRDQGAVDLPPPGPRFGISGQLAHERVVESGRVYQGRSWGRVDVRRLWPAHVPPRRRSSWRKSALYWPGRSPS